MLARATGTIWLQNRNKKQRHFKRPKAAIHNRRFPLRAGARQNTTLSTNVRPCALRLLTPLAHEITLKTDVF